MLYRPEIDGLRALAIVPVVFFHFGVPGFTGGYIGVDIFFVISGYLITTIILNDLNEGTFYLSHFCVRRVRRILPALCFVIVVCMPMAAVWLNPVDASDFYRSVVAAFSFSSNFLFWFESGYFDTEAELKPLLHTWSLAVEGQYYLLFPIYLLWLSRYGEETIILHLAAAFIFSLILAHWGAYHYSEATFYLFPTRLWELLLGAFCALYLYRDKKSYGPVIDQCMSVVGLVLIVSSVVCFDQSTPTPSLWTLIPTLGAALIILYSHPGTAVNYILASMPIVSVGMISYSLYLWHFPLLAFLKNITLGAYGYAELITVLLASCILSVVSYFYVERPFRQKAKLSRKTLIALPIVVPIILIFGASYGFLDLKDLQKKAADESEKYLMAMEDWAYPGELKKGLYPQTYSTHIGVPPHIMFVGDSHAQQYGPLITKLASQNALPPTLFLTGGGCAPIPNVFEDSHRYCRDFIDRFEAILAESPSVHTVVLTGCFNCYFIQHTRSWGTKHRYYYEDENGIKQFRRGEGKTYAIDTFREFVSRLSIRYNIVVILDNPSSQQFNPKIALSAVEYSNSYIAKRYPNYEPNDFAHDSAQIALAKELKDALDGLNVKIIDVAPIICPEDRCNAMDENGIPIYKDSHHMRPFFVQSQFDELMRRIAPTPQGAVGNMPQLP